MEETTQAEGACARNGAQSDELQPTVDWDRVSYMVSDQKMHTSYEKPEMAPPVVDARTGKTTTRVASYGKMVTKTVTMTVTMTIATTEILRPGESGYEESLERQKRQQHQTPEERERQQRGYHQSRRWASGDRTLHENFHCKHHRSAQPARKCVNVARFLYLLLILCPVFSPISGRFLLYSLILILGCLGLKAT